MYKKLLKYGLLFIGVYLVVNLFFNVPGVKQAHANFYTSMNEGVIKTFMPKLFMRFDPGDKDNPYVRRVVFNSQKSVDAQVAEAKRNRTRNINLQVYDFNFDIFILYILPLGFLLALILASPVPWRRKLFAVGFGYVMLLVVCLIRLYILCLHQVSRESMDIYQYSDGKVNTLGTLSSFFTPGFMIILTVFIWIAATFRKEDYKQLRTLIEGQTRA